MIAWLLDDCLIAAQRGLGQNINDRVGCDYIVHLGSTKPWRTGLLPNSQDNHHRHSCKASVSSVWFEMDGWDAHYRWCIDMVVVFRRFRTKNYEECMLFVLHVSKRNNTMKYCTVLYCIMLLAFGVRGILNVMLSLLILQYLLVLSTMYVCMVITYIRVWSTGWGCQSCSWSAEQGKLIFPCPRACVPENLVPRDGFSRPVPRQLAHLHTQAESGMILLILQPPRCLVLSTRVLVIEVNVTRTVPARL